MMDKLLWIVFAVSCSYFVTVEACFPHNYWISCLLNTCKLGGKCPGEPTAACRMERSDCNGCKAVWYNLEGNRANCTAPRDLTLCPGGEPVVQCLVNTCNWPCSHPDFRGAECRQTYCGTCEAEYLVQGTWKACPTDARNVTGEEIPFDVVVADQSRVGCRSVPCSIEVCFAEKCPAVQRAVCRPDGCNRCKAAWFLDNLRVNCQTGDFIQNNEQPFVNNPVIVPSPWQRTCATGEPLVSCGLDVCQQKTCRNYPNAVCRPDGCGSCKDTWFVDNQLVDCLSDACPPNVPFVKCVDDPCKYFAHYCPTAECRASQCGTCEAKFFSNGVEVDCVQPAKQCPAGIQPNICPWFTCPANICPSNNRLMCRIDPCGQQCKYEWVDIYNGEIMGCRTFDGESGPDPALPPPSNKIFLRDPLMSMFEPQAKHTGPLYIEKNPSLQQMSATKAMLPPVRQETVIDPVLKEAILEKSLSIEPKLPVEPIFVNPGPPIVQTDVQGLLRAFPHEIQAMSSQSIKNALKKHKVDGTDGIIPVVVAPVDLGTNVIRDIISSRPIPGERVQATNGMLSMDMSKEAVSDLNKMTIQSAGLQTFKLPDIPVPMIPDIVPSVQIRDILNTVDIPQDVQEPLPEKPFKPLYDELTLIPGSKQPALSSNPVMDAALLKGPSPFNTPIDIGSIKGPHTSIDMNNMASIPNIIPAGKPSHMQAPVVETNVTPKPVPTVFDVADLGGAPLDSVPISMGLFNRWATSRK